MNPLHIARTAPDKPAVVMTSTGATRTYASLADAIRRIAMLFTSVGLRRGNHIALLLENRVEFLEICWAAQLSGLYYTPIATHLRPEEISYIVRDCEAQILITSSEFRAIIDEMPHIHSLQRRYCIGGALPGFLRWEDTLAEVSDRHEPEFRPTEGMDMLYSSGTTGRPKGVKRSLPPPEQLGGGALSELSRRMFGYDETTRYLSPAPLYHAAPLRSNMTVMRCGGTCFVMDKFEPLKCLELIQVEQITHAQFVPTMFVRFLRLPLNEREGFNLSSLRTAIHAAAPCPIPVKEQMIEWWGPVLYEYYGGTEGNGICALTSREWLEHRGSVGKALIGTLRIVNEEGRALPVGERGGVYFEGGPAFQYHNDAERTAQSHLPNGWSTLGDIGYLDAEGYLYLVDRKSFTIISGGVNIYPQEIEDVLLLHPSVSDVAVIGVPDEEFGESVKAVVQLKEGIASSSELAAQLISFCRSKLSPVKAPRSVDFRSSLPRTPVGKLQKQALRDEYLQKRTP